MGRVLASTVVVYHPDEQKTVALAAGTELPDWAEGLVDDSRLDNPLARISDVGATDDEADALQRFWEALTDDQRTMARAENPTDDDLSGFLAEVRTGAAAMGISFSEAIDRALAEGLTDDLGSSDTSPPKALGDYKKDELVDIAAKHEIELPTRATKDEIVEALRAAGIEG